MKIRKLNLKDITKIYLLLQPSLENRDREEILFDELEKLIELSPPKTLLDCLHIIYGNKVEFDSPREFISLLVNGLLEVEFYEFVEFIKVLKNGSTR